MPPGSRHAIFTRELTSLLEILDASWTTLNVATSICVSATLLSWTKLIMGFAEDVEVILKGAGSSNNKKMQCLLFSATTLLWVKEIRLRYQKNAFSMTLQGIG
jgi:hypothetical protein